MLPLSLRRASVLAALVCSPLWAGAQALVLERVGAGAVTGLSADGSVAVGAANRSYEAFRWTAAGGLVKLWRAEAADGRGGAAGTIVAAGPDGLVVACGEGLLRVTELQPAGGRRMAAAAFVAGRRVAPGQRFDVAAAPAEAAD